jgi:hypothetical protein
MEEKIEQEAENVVLRRHLAEERIDKQSIRYKVYNAMQEFGNQRFNAALSEAIEKINKTSEWKKLDPSYALEILEGLKIKP